MARAREMHPDLYGYGTGHSTLTAQLKKNYPNGTRVVPLWNQVILIVSLHGEPQQYYPWPLWPVRVLPLALMARKGSVRVLPLALTEPLRARASSK